MRSLLPSALLSNDATPKSDLSTASGGRPRLGLIALGGALTAAIRGIHHEFHIGTICMDPYWVNFYLTGFQDGFRRRALVGTIVRWVAPHAADVRLLNLFALLIAGLLVGIFLYALTRLCGRTSSWSVIFLFALCSSAFLSVDFEVLGDLLQVAFVLFLVTALLPRTLGNAWKLAWMLGALALGAAIHEASIFFIAPCIPFVLNRWPRLRDFVLPVAAALCLLALSLHWSDDHAHLTYAMAQYPHPVTLTEPIGAGDYGSHVQAEYTWDLVDTHARIFFATRLVSCCLLAFAGLVALANCIDRTALARVLYALTWLSVFSVPLWFIAHDWGRFMSYNLLFAVIVSLFDRAEPASLQQQSTQPVEAFYLRLADRLDVLSHNELVRLACLLLLFISPFLSNRHLLLRREDSASCIIVLGLAFIAQPKKPGRKATITSRHTATEAAISPAR